ncbi:MAG: NAD-dependent epimerase [Acidobacteria bacterium]|nr:MAG: NAD-dependent epimerase [Acidobacteriota bacterium]
MNSTPSNLHRSIGRLPRHFERQNATRNARRVLVTGGCGFIAHHFIEHMLEVTDWDIVALDHLDYASNGFDRLRDIPAFDDRRVQVFTVDVAGGVSVGLRKEIGPVDYIFHLAAETHVDNSIRDPWPFVRSNVIGTYQMLEYAGTVSSLKWFVYMSTDEVFGAAPPGVSFKEWDRYNSSNPYSATKAAGEEMTLAWANTYGLPAFVIHAMNAFGERQHPEKFFPKVVNAVLEGRLLPIHSDATCTVSSSRCYIHARNIASAILFLVSRAEQREKYNIAGERDIPNLELAQRVAEIIGKPLHYEFVPAQLARPGLDFRYSLDGSRMKSMGWEPPNGFEESLERTVRWMIQPENMGWLRPDLEFKPTGEPAIEIAA